MISGWKIVVRVIVNVLMVSQVHGTAISNMNLVFETFSPTSMVRFFEFNDVGWNITEKCIKDMFLYLDGLHKDILWAVKREYFRIDNAISKLVMLFKPIK